MTACGETRLVMAEPIRMQIEMAGPSVEYEGVYVSNDLLERVKIKETGSDWLLAVFGEPTGQYPLRDGTEIWRWSYKPLESKAAMVSVFGGSKDQPTPEPATAFVRIQNGIVIEKWRG